jgi:hypothetical protein
MDACSNYNLNRDGEKMSPANVCGDLDFFCHADGCMSAIPTPHPKKWQWIKTRWVLLAQTHTREEKIRPLKNPYL